MKHISIFCIVLQLTNINFCSQRQPTSQTLSLIALLSPQTIEQARNHNGIAIHYNETTNASIISDSTQIICNPTPTEITFHAFNKETALVFTTESQQADGTFVSRQTEIVTQQRAPEQQQRTNPHVYLHPYFPSTTATVPNCTLCIFTWPKNPIISHSIPLYAAFLIEHARENEAPPTKIQHLTGRCRLPIIIAQKAAEIIRQGTAPLPTSQES